MAIEDMRISRLLFTATLLIGVCPLPSAEAAATFPRIDATGFQLVSGDTFSTYAARVAQLETKPQLAPVGVTEVLAASNRTGRNLCHPTYLTASLDPQGFCWQDGADVVATSGSVLRVFDLRHLWRTDTSTGEVGLGADGKYHALWHAFALPQLGAHWYAGGGCASSTGVKPCFASLGIDHAGDGSFVAVEHTVRGGGRIVRWPLNESIGLPRAGADGLDQSPEEHREPVLLAGHRRTLADERATAGARDRPHPLPLRAVDHLPVRMGR